MSQAVATHIELRTNRSGQSRAFIAGTRVRVQDIYGLSQLQGHSAEEISSELPHLTLGQVYAALSYYFDHREEIMLEIRESEATAAEMREHFGPGPMEQRRNEMES